jgi:4'-phosphopantetheinyl transferase EntD
MPIVPASIFGSITFWSGMALATLYVFLVVRSRGRRQREQWKKQDREWSLHDPDEDDEPPDDANLP